VGVDLTISRALFDQNLDARSATAAFSVRAENIDARRGT
jgi:hypothetical protein